MSVRRRLDTELVRRGLADNRTQAQQLIATGAVRVAGAVALRSARLVAPGEPVVVASRPRFVSRGGEKLDGALAAFDVDVAGKVCLDAGASTGGFTDCLLQRGAAAVVALDVGRAQLHERLAADPRVRSLERTNLRQIDRALLPEAPFAVVVADLSFISLRTVAPELVGLAAPGANLVVLIKPQFEAGRQVAARARGVIRDPAVWAEAILAAGTAIEAEGAAMMGAMVSPLRGADGNVEFLAHFRAQATPPPGPLATRVGIDELVAGVEGGEGEGPR